MLKNMLIASVSIVVSLIAAEMLTRIWFPTCTVLKISNEEWGVYFEPGQKSRCAGRDFDNIVRTNSTGFHDFEHPKTITEKEFRIAVLGDSMIGAVQVSREANITHQLESILPSTEALNFGISGNGPPQYLRLLENHILSYKPDMVLLFLYLGNDIRNSSPDLNDPNAYPFYTLTDSGELKYQPPQARAAEGSFTRRFLSHFHIVRKLREALRSTSMNTIFYRLGLTGETPHIKSTRAYPIDWLVYRKNLETESDLAYRYFDILIHRISMLLNKNDIKLVIIGIPSSNTTLEQWPEAFQKYQVPLHAEAWDFLKPDRHTSSLCHKLKIPYISLIESYQGSDTPDRIYLAHDGHWSEYGHRLTAEIIAPQISRLLQKEVGK